MIVKKRALNGLEKLIKRFPKQLTSPEITSKWLSHITKQWCGRYSSPPATLDNEPENRTTRFLAWKIFRAASPHIGSIGSSNMEHLRQELEQHGLAMISALGMNYEAVSGWGLVTLLLRHVLVRDMALLNKLLSVVESYFKSPNVQVRKAGFEFWKCQVDVFGLTPGWSYKEKKVKMVMLPLLNCLRKETPDPARYAAMECWSYVVAAVTYDCCVATKESAKSLAKKKLKLIWLTEVVIRMINTMIDRHFEDERIQHILLTTFQSLFVFTNNTASNANMKKYHFDGSQEFHDEHEAMYVVSEESSSDTFSDSCQSHEDTSETPRRLHYDHSSMINRLFISPFQMSDHELLLSSLYPGFMYLIKLLSKKESQEVTSKWMDIGKVLWKALSHQLWKCFRSDIESKVAHRLILAIYEKKNMSVMWKIRIFQECWRNIPHILMESPRILSSFRQSVEKILGKIELPADNAIDYYLVLGGFIALFQSKDIADQTKKELECAQNLMTVWIQKMIEYRIKTMNVQQDELVSKLLECIDILDLEIKLDKDELLVSASHEEEEQVEEGETSFGKSFEIDCTPIPTPKSVHEHSPYKGKQPRQRSDQVSHHQSESKINHLSEQKVEDSTEEPKRVLDMSVSHDNLDKDSSPHARASEHHEQQPLLDERERVDISKVPEHHNESSEPSALSTEKNRLNRTSEFSDTALSLIGLQTTLTPSQEDEGQEKDEEQKKETPVVDIEEEAVKNEQLENEKGESEIVHENPSDDKVKTTSPSRSLDKTTLDEKAPQTPKRSSRPRFDFHTPESTGKQPPALHPPPWGLESPESPCVFAPDGDINLLRSTDVSPSSSSKPGDQEVVFPNLVHSEEPISSIYCHFPRGFRTQFSFFNVKTVGDLSRLSPRVIHGFGIKDPMVTVVNALTEFQGRKARLEQLKCSPFKSPSKVKSATTPTKNHCNLIKRKALTPMTYHHHHHVQSRQSLPNWKKRKPGSSTSPSPSQPSKRTKRALVALNLNEALPESTVPKIAEKVCFQITTATGKDRVIRPGEDSQLLSGGEDQVVNDRDQKWSQIAQCLASVDQLLDELPKSNSYPSSVSLTHLTSIHEQLSQLQTKLWRKSMHDRAS